MRNSYDLTVPLVLLTARTSRQKANEALRRSHEQSSWKVSFGILKRLQQSETERRELRVQRNEARRLAASKVPALIRTHCVVDGTKSQLKSWRITVEEGSSSDCAHLTPRQK
ncbi:hypothetical protein E4U19_002755 [Claviceps sp. Clav32 group G5]|nr:hypothetical protein E4U19_002755 [Claviceps sp. Clav32 group G5]